LCDFVQTKVRSPKQMMLSFDEFGSWPEPKMPLSYGKGGRQNVSTFYQFNPERKYIRHDPDDWSTRRMRMFMGDIFNAITSASTMLTFLRHADRVKIGCMTGGLGALAATDRDHVWKPAAHYSFTDLIKYGRGVSLLPSVDCDTYDIPGYATSDFHQYDTHEGVPYIESAAAFDEANGELNVFVINRNWEENTSLELDVTGFAGYRFIEQIQLCTDDLDAANTYENPDVIKPSVSSAAKFENGRVSTTVNRLSWNVFRFKKN